MIYRYGIEHSECTTYTIFDQAPVCYTRGVDLLPFGPKAHLQMFPTRLEARFIGLVQSLQNGQVQRGSPPARHKASSCCGYVTILMV